MQYAIKTQSPSLLLVPTSHLCKLYTEPQLAPNNKQVTIVSQNQCSFCEKFQGQIKAKQRNSPSLVLNVNRILLLHLDMVKVNYVM